MKLEKHGQAGTQHKADVAVAIYFFWHIWKERGRRIFQKELMPESVVAGLVRSDIELLLLAKGLRCFFFCCFIESGGAV